MFRSFHWRPGGFVRYGEDKPASIENDDYADDWDALVIGDHNYTSNQTSMNGVKSAFEGIADDRNECYEYPATGFYTQLGYITSTAAKDAAEALLNSYPDNMAGTYKWLPTGSSGNYGYAVYQQPAFLMQLIAAKQSWRITEASFVLTQVAPYLAYAKDKLTLFAGGGYMNHPHYPESYYLLATVISS